VLGCAVRFRLDLAGRFGLHGRRLLETGSTIDP